MTNALVIRYGKTHLVRVQLPLSLSEYSEPGPDFALVPRETLLTADRHPVRADLVIEVSDSSLEFDRAKKSLLYAKANIPEYWVVVIRQRLVEVRTEPSSEGYRQKATLCPDESLAPVSIDGEELPIEEFLPEELI